MKWIVVLILSFLVLNATQKISASGGCTLSQEGEIKVAYDGNRYKSVKYQTITKSGKNFREIFVGSKISIENQMLIEIIDYKPNKRVKGKPKTGLFIVDIIKNNKRDRISMVYIFDKGVISAIGLLDKKSVQFTTNVNYSFCKINR